MKPQEIIALTNQYRKSQGLPPLSVSKQLMQAAQDRAQDMANTGNFSHTVATTTPGVTPGTFVLNAGYDYGALGENLGTLFDNSKDLVSAWQASPAHKKNLDNDVFKDIGIGVAPVKYKGKDTVFVVQFFGNKGSVIYPKTAQPSLKTAITTAKSSFSKLGFGPTLNTAKTTPPVIPNKVTAKPLSL